MVLILGVKECKYCFDLMGLLKDYIIWKCRIVRVILWAFLGFTLVQICDRAFQIIYTTHKANDNLNFLSEHWVSAQFSTDVSSLPILAKFPPDNYHYQFNHDTERHLVTRLSSAPPWNSLVHFGPLQRPINPTHVYNKYTNKSTNI